MITIRMPKESLDKWITALESGEYRQATGMLYRDKGYCCLGVLQHCLQGKVETDDAGDPRGLPSVMWLKEWNIEFMRGDVLIDDNTDDYGNKIPWTSPYLPTLKDTAHMANDNHESFKNIAAAIRECSEANDAENLDIVDSFSKLYEPDEYEDAFKGRTDLEPKND